MVTCPPQSTWRQLGATLQIQHCGILSAYDLLVLSYVIAHIKISMFSYNIFHAQLPKYIAQVVCQCKHTVAHSCPVWAAGLTRQKRWWRIKDGTALDSQVVTLTILPVSSSLLVLEVQRYRCLLDVLLPDTSSIAGGAFTFQYIFFLINTTSIFTHTISL